MLKLALVLAALVRPDAAAAESKKIDAVLDGFHAAAAKADEKAYFGALAENAVFLGTDATERWTKEQFRAFCKPYFTKGQGWLYAPKQRKIDFAADGRTAWFDELLENKKNGLCRGSGVLMLVGGDWKIAQYNLSIPIPNDVWPKVKPFIDAAMQKDK